MNLTFLGTAAVVPGGGHDTASLILNGEYLIDTGWYAAIKMQLYGFDPLRLRCLFLTHCHHDHYVGLPQILFYRAMRKNAAPSGLPPLKIVGPAGEVERVTELARQFLQGDRFPEAVADFAVVPLTPGDAYEDDVLRVATCASRHPVPGLCYRITEKASGAVAALTGDTAYDSSVVEHVRGAALLVTEASYGAKPAPAENRSLHMGAPDAARMAWNAGVERLALVHGLAENQTSALAAARAIFPSTFWPADGETITVAG